jgi:TetR/AcrR family transcriptional regulator, cholesterol catabolism regulator
MYSQEALQKKKEMIFEAALSCFNEAGYDKTSIDSIAQKAGISKGGLYHYISSKKELFLELFDYKVNRYFEQMKAYTSKDQPPEEQLRILVAKAGEILKENEDFYRFCLEFLSMGVRDAEIRHVMTNFYKSSIATFKDIIDEAIRTGRFAAVDSSKVARSLYLAVMGAFFTYFSVDVDFDLTDQHDFELNNILNSLQKK